MQTPLRVSTQRVTLSEPVYGMIEKEAKRLERFFSRIVGCQVTIEGPSNHHRQGMPYRVSLLIEVPGKDLAVSHKGHQVLETAIRQAFEAGQRRLEDYASKLRGDVKTHPDQAAAAGGEGL